MQKGTVVIMNIVDNVATAISDLTKDQEIRTDEGDVVKTLQEIPFGHKVAIAEISKGLPIKKYGETIGLAIADIKKGEHVHIHNTDGCRGRGDNKGVK